MWEDMKYGIGDPFTLIHIINYVNASYNSIHGLIVSNWKKNNKTFQWKISIPPNTTAEVYIPAKSNKTIKANGASIANAKGIEYIKDEGDRVHLRLLSGNYELSSKLYLYLIGILTLQMKTLII